MDHTITSISHGPYHMVRGLYLTWPNHSRAIIRVISKRNLRNAIFVTDQYRLKILYDMVYHTKISSGEFGRIRRSMMHVKTENGLKMGNGYNPSHNTVWIIWDGRYIWYVTYPKMGFWGKIRFSGHNGYRFFCLSRSFWIILGCA